MRVWNFASHNITLWFSFYVDVGIHLRGTYIIHHTPYTPYGHEVELDWNRYSNSLFRYIISRHTISSCVFPFFPFFPCVFVIFSLCWGEARLFPLGTLPLLMYHLLLLFLLCFFHNSHAGYRPALFIISLPFLAFIYTSNLCVGEGDFVYGMCCHLVLVVFVYFDWMGTQWRYCISLSL